MDLLNNLNTIVSLILDIFGIGGYVYGITMYLRHKVASSQKHKTIRQSSQLQNTQPDPVGLSWMDWMEVLWLGFEDCIRARNGSGCATAIGVLICGVMIVVLPLSVSAPNTVGIALSIFGVLYFTFITLFYVYFVGRRVEELVEEKNDPLIMLLKRR